MVLGAALIKQTEKKCSTYFQGITVIKIVIIGVKKTAILAERLAITEPKPSQEAIDKMSELNAEPKQCKI